MTSFYAASCSLEEFTKYTRFRTMDVNFQEDPERQNDPLAVLLEAGTKAYTIDNINLEAEFEEGLIMPNTMKSYNVYLKMFFVFVSSPWNEDAKLPIYIFTDLNIAKFMIHLLNMHNGMPHIKKAAQAGLVFMLGYQNLPCWNEQPTQWPNTMKAVKVKVSAYFKNETFFNLFFQKSGCHLKKSHIILRRLLCGVMSQLCICMI